MDECKLSSLSQPSFRKVVDSTQLIDPNSQSESITDIMNNLSPASSGENIKAEYVMESTDYTRVEPRSCLNRSENKEQRIERKTGNGMSREEKDILSNIKEEEGWEWPSAKIEEEDVER
ncbi:hypothetical protein AAFF_G00277280 [Aldrovandia affinis]|uniref:Uncharacterized protein n=1 Tax=Aldrovandia affinis TaxID=143900 RepID=A0AAD7W242_9TELE|nr:hypothetical protein AAFF_G00277280 [Aldrovandia affinis]